MIVYENTINKFIEHCNINQIAQFVYDSTKNKGFGVSDSEKNSWANSLPFMAKVLDDPEIDKEINVAIEYKFDITKNRLDFLIYGFDDNNQENVVVIELKQWSTAKNSNKPNYVYTNGGGGIGDYEHPSYQSFRYRHILNGFNSYVQDNKVNVTSCSFLHNMESVYKNVLTDEKKYKFLETSPVFLKDDIEKLNIFIKKYIKKKHRMLLYEIDNARIRPSSQFSELMYNAIKGQPIFSLDDQQQFAVSTIVEETTKAIVEKKRRTIIIKGGPGTGKSIVAINALGQLIHPNDGSEPKNAVFSTANFTPRKLFEEQLIQNDYTKVAISELFKELSVFTKASEFDYDCIILDEAHRAYNWKFGKGVKRNLNAVDKLFYASLVNVFFIDEDQIVTKDDYLTIDIIKQFAKKYNSKIIEAEDLKLTSQFRILGGENYISFINSFLGYNSNKKTFNSNKNYEFKVFDSPSELWEAIKEKQEEYPVSRLLSGYTYNWISKNKKDEENVYDFNLENGNFQMRWNKNVSYSFILDKDQSDRIGSIHTIQGVDMDFAGVIIGKDLSYREGKLCFNQNEIAKTDRASGIRNATKIDAEKMIRNTYKVLLTRAINGTYVYCEDKELNNYLKGLIK